MSYTSLYRKFRPKVFEDVKGQDHIVTTLKNQIKANRVGHAYLFCGTRGTGKTTVAKIFAKAVNCENPADGSPCGKCKMCAGIESGSLMNVIEIDAASNNGVDNIRELREEVAYRPTSGRYKVYIIDEVHMLSAGAFNALLKTLEEPPEYVIFILATTELHKIPVTIVSRCQQYQFRRLGIADISGRIQELMKLEGVEIEDRAVRYVAKIADGSMRDALSLLDQCISFYIGQKLTYEKVLEVLGTVDSEVFGELLRSLESFDAAGALKTVEELSMLGKELSQVTLDFIWYLRNLLLVKTSDNIEDVLDVSYENMKQLKADAESVGTDALFRYIRIFSELSGQMKYAPQKRVLLEMSLIKICRPEMESGPDSLSERIRALEEKLKNGIPAAAAENAQGAPDGEAQYAKKRPPKRERRAEELPEALPEDVKKAVSAFESVKEETTGYLHVLLKDARAQAGDGGGLVIVVEDVFKEEALGKEDRKKEIEAMLGERLGKRIEVRIRCIVKKEEDAFYAGAKKINMDLVEE